MSRGQMLDLGQKALELVVERIESLPGENAWEGEFRQVLEDQLFEDPPEHGRPAGEVIERAAREVLPFTLRNDHPRSFGFIPSSPTWPGVVADFMAAGYHVNQCTWLVASGPSQLELVVIDWFRRWLGYPEGAGGLFTSGGSAASVDAFVAAREAAGHPKRATVYMSDQSHSALSRAAFIVGIGRDVHPHDPERRGLPRGHGCPRQRRGSGPRRRPQPHRGRRQRRHGGHGSHRQARGIGRLLRSGRSLAACRCRLRRLRRGDGAGQAAPARDRTRRFDRSRCAQVVLPALRSGLSTGEGREHAPGRLRRSGPTSFRTRSGGRTIPTSPISACN